MYPCKKKLSQDTLKTIYIDTVLILYIPNGWHWTDL